MILKVQIQATKRNEAIKTKIIILAFSYKSVQIDVIKVNNYIIWCMSIKNNIIELHVQHLG